MFSLFWNLLYMCVIVQLYEYINRNNNFNCSIITYDENNLMETSKINPHGCINLKDTPTQLGQAT